MVFCAALRYGEAKERIDIPSAMRAAYGLYIADACALI